VRATVAATHGADRLHGADPGGARRTMRYGVAMALRIPAVLAFTVVGATAAGAAVALSCGGRGAPPPDAATNCLVYCIPTDAGSNGCTPPTCATGPNHDVCPMGCRPDPIT
jgi:hypothetical protein